ncbi:MAG TPA: beta-propeller domain-containing protein, partial [Phycisphaerae bacterium]
MAREIEEADIVKYVDGFFYLANRYRGLRIIDARFIERPRLVGGLALQGRGVELFVDRDRVFIVTSADFFSCAGQPVSFADSDLGATLLRPDYTGSRITVVDVSDPSAPTEISHFDLDGFVTATRRVGDVIYAAGNFQGAAASNSNSNSNANTNANSNRNQNANLNVNGSSGPPPPSTTGQAVVVGADGTAVASATSPAGFDGQISISGGTPGAFIQTRVSDGITHASRYGIRGTLVPATVTGITNLQTGDLMATVSLQVSTS